MATPIDPLPPQEVAAVLAAPTLPLVKRDRLIFAYHGPADGVQLVHWVRPWPGDLAFEPIAGTELWCLSIAVAPGSRIEYKLHVRRGGDSHWITDPLNERLAHDPFGANSVAYAWGYSPPPWTEHCVGTPRGRLEPIDVEPSGLPGPRTSQVYLPANFSPNERYPVLVFHDGDDYVRYSSLLAVLDRLIAARDIPPLIAVLTSPVLRDEEYAANPAHASYLVENLLPAVERQFSIATERRVLIGASLGAVSALATASWYPDAFFGLLLQSGSFVSHELHGHGRGELFRPVVKWLGEFRAARGLVASRAFVTCGLYESLVDQNRLLYPVLATRVEAIEYREARDGHNWQNWRDRLREGLTWLLRETP